MNLVSIAERKSALEVQELGLRCDESEMPHPLGIDRADRYFVGMGSVQAEDSMTVGTIASCLFEGKIGTIVAPLDDAEPSRWLILDVEGMSVRTEGRLGIVQRRPANVELRSNGMTLLFKVEIMEFFPVRRVMQRRRSASFVEALESL